MKIVYTDASYSRDKNIYKGLLCCVVNSHSPLYKEAKVRVDKGYEMRVALLELKAIEWAIELYGNDCIIYTDSQIATRWSNNSQVKWIPRRQNIAGKYIEKKLNSQKQIEKNILTYLDKYVKKEDVRFSKKHKKKQTIKTISPVVVKEYLEDWEESYD